MPKILEVQALPGHRLRLRCSDGVEGVLDLSHVVGRGVFHPLRDERAFARVGIGAQGQIAWGDDLELCPDAAWLRLAGKTPEDAFPGLRRVPSDA